MVNRQKKIEVSGLSVAFGNKDVIRNITFDVSGNEVLGIIGPAQSGKTTLLKVLNRTLELVPQAKIDGIVRVDGENIREIKDVYSYRRRVGMVAPLPVGLPLSVYDNVAFAPRRAGLRKRAPLHDLVEKCLRNV